MKLIEYQGEVLSEYVPDLPKQPEGAAKCCVLLGRPTDNPKSYRESFRLSETDMKKMNFAYKKQE